MISGNQELFEIKKMLWFRLALFLVVVGGCFAKLLDTEENGKEAQWREGFCFSFVMTFYCEVFKLFWILQNSNIAALFHNSKSIN